MHVPNQQKGSKIIYTEYHSEAPQSLYLIRVSKLNIVRPSGNKIKNYETTQTHQYQTPWVTYINAIYA